MPATKQNVLIVEDDPLPQMIAFDIVSDAGFEPLVATNATEAISILESRKDIRLVFTDIDLPDGIDGLKLAALIQDRWPTIAILITSGHIKPRNQTLPVRCMFLPKPYRLECVVSALRTLAA